MKKFLFFLLLAFSIIITSCSSDAKRVSEENQLSLRLDLETFKTKYAEAENPLLLDVRTPEEFEQGAIEGAINADFNSATFDQQLDALNKAQPTFIYCQSGGRSEKALRKMRSKGFQEVYELQTGYRSWK